MAGTELQSLANGKAEVAQALEAQLCDDVKSTPQSAISITSEPCQKRAWA